LLEFLNKQALALEQASGIAGSVCLNFLFDDTALAVTDLGNKRRHGDLSLMFKR
jgi:hypothetical protein